MLLASELATSGVTIGTWEKLTFMQMPCSAQGCKTFTENVAENNRPVSTEYVNKLKLCSKATDYQSSKTQSVS